jgi:hypothetical protein
MIKLPSLLPKKSTRVAVSISILFFCITSDVFGEGINIRRYVLPLYPAMSNRACYEAIFSVAIDIAAGIVSDVRIISSDVFGLGNTKLDGSPPVDFVRSIRDALSRWEFDQANQNESRTIEITIEFRLAKTITTADKESFVYQIQEKNNLPWKIRIEAYRIGNVIEK